MPVRIELRNRRFGKLRVIGDGGRDARGKILWRCLCDCGNESTVAGAYLRNGDTRSCGCSKHGFSRTLIYRVWVSMISRCEDRNYEGYHSYGGRGIRVCPKWREDFMAFYNDMGAPPKGYSIDRIDTDGNYEPGNCRWATAKEQANNRRNNRRLTSGGRTMTITAWADEVGITVQGMRARIRLGWPVDDAVSIQRGGNRYGRR